MQPRRGRPRDERYDATILDATLDLVADVGFGGLTIDAVAVRAKVGKAAIYRRWGIEGSAAPRSLGGLCCADAGARYRLAAG